MSIGSGSEKQTFSYYVSAGVTVGKDFDEKDYASVGPNLKKVAYFFISDEIYIDMRTIISYDNRVKNFVMKQFSDDGFYSSKEMYFYENRYSDKRIGIDVGGLKFDFLSNFNAKVELHGTDYGDFFRGTSFNDTFKPNGGNDKVYGEAGSDYIYGGSGRDIVDGGSGIDTLDYQLHSSGVNVSLVSSVVYKTDGGIDKLAGIENIVGSKYADILRGDDSDNYLRGVAGSDSYYGEGGEDRILVSEVPVIVDGGLGSDDLLIGGAKKFVFTDSNFKDIEAIYIQSASSLDMSGVTEGVKIVAQNNEWSRISIIGTQGDDSIYTGNGRDIIDGGAGNDRLISGSASDIFKFRGEFGVDRIIDFNANKDFIDLSDLASGMSDIDISKVHDGEGTMITINSLDGDTNRIVLHDTDIDRISEKNFLFDI